MEMSLTPAYTMPLPAWLAPQNHAALVALLRRYYAGRLDDKNLGPGFLGAYFDEWADRAPGDAVREPDIIGAADLYAMEYLSVSIPSAAGVEFLHRQSGELSGLLAQIPTEVDLWDMDEELYARVSQLQSKLREPAGVAYVKSAKIIAKKRPRLTCVFDSNVKRAFGIRAGSYLLPLARMLQENPEVVELLGQLRTNAGLPQSISDTRVLDVLAWMIGREGLSGVDAA